MSEWSQRTGDPVHETIQKYSDMVYRLAFCKTQNRFDAEDIYQDVFMKLFSEQRHFESEEHKKAWLIKTTVNMSINLIKSAWRRYTAGEKETLPAAEHANANPQREKLMAALKSLSEKYRVVLYLHYYEDLSTDKIAEITGASPTAVRSQLMRGRKKLKRMIEEMEVD
ncbi:MAG: sigma-70 family RNA polymerase sigma factor [Clostridia bacterium]|nr:sigma-70 family RNA polymerase sigma factor [Clostridia bacterium]